jgi:hypothetical protein
VRPQAYYHSTGGTLACFYEHSHLTRGLPGAVRTRRSFGTRGKLFNLRSSPRRLIILWYRPIQYGL